MISVLRRAQAGSALAVAAGLLSAFVSAPIATADTLVTAVEDVNIRSGPSTTTEIVGGLDQGQAVTAISTTAGWTKVRFTGGTAGIAYIASQYLAAKSATPTPTPTSTPTPTPTPTPNPQPAPVPVLVNAGATRVTTTNVNLRKGPGLAYAVIRVVPNRTAVVLTGRASKGFSEVRLAGSIGWISQQYLASTTTGLPKIIGTRLTLARLILRTTSGSDYKKVGELKKGTRVSVTGTTQNGRAQIVYANAVRWVTAKYLSNLTVTAPTAPGLPKIIGVRYATTALLIRSTSTASFTTITEVPRGTALGITGVVQNARAQVVYENAVRWVTAKYLSTTAVPAGGSGNIYAVEKGLKPNAIKVHRASLAKFPQIVTYYGVRRDSIPDHPSGRALDLMIPNYKSKTGRALGFAVAGWARTNARVLGIEYVIWDQHIWNIRRDSEGWRYMAGRGSDSANHKNHVHITVFA